MDVSNSNSQSIFLIPSGTFKEHAIFLFLLKHLFVILITQRLHLTLWSLLIRRNLRFKPTSFLWLTSNPFLTLVSHVPYYPPTILTFPTWLISVKFENPDGELFHEGRNKYICTDWVSYSILCFRLSENVSSIRENYSFGREILQCFPHFYLKEASLTRYFFSKWTFLTETFCLGGKEL